MARGTMDFNDIYPNLGTAKAGDDGDNTKQKTNASTADLTTDAPKTSIFNIKGGFLGQPLIVWLGLIGALVLVKFVAEKEAV